MFREREEDDYRRLQIIDRWQNAGRSILSSVRMVRNAETLGDKFASGAERYVTLGPCGSAIEVVLLLQQSVLGVTQPAICCI